LPRILEHYDTTRLDHTGELGTDFGIAGQRWADRVAAAWEAAVRSPARASEPEQNAALNQKLLIHDAPLLPRSGSPSVCLLLIHLDVTVT
jgi:hypothetical protein